MSNSKTTDPTTSSPTSSGPTSSGPTSAPLPSSPSLSIFGSRKDELYARINLLETERHLDTVNYTGRDVYQMLVTRAALDRVTLPPYSDVASYLDQQCWDALKYFACNPLKRCLNLELFPIDQDAKDSDNIVFYVTMYRIESVLQLKSKLIDCRNEDPVWIDVMFNILDNIDLNDNAPVWLYYTGVSFGPNSTPFKRSLDSLKSNRRVKMLGLTRNEGTFSLLELRKVGEVDKLEQIFRYGIGESAINIAPGGILQEFVADQSAMDMSMFIRQEAHISEPVLSDYIQKLIGKANELNGVDDNLKALYDAIVDKNVLRNSLIVTDSVLRNLSKVQEILKVSHNLIPKDHVIEDSDLKSSLKSMYDNYPLSFKKLFQSKRNTDTVIEEASCIFKYRSTVLSGVLGLDVTEEDVQARSGFWDSPGQGPKYFKEMLKITLGPVISKDDVLWGLFVGFFRDLWEVPLKKYSASLEDTTCMLDWLKKYLELVQPKTLLILGDSLLKLFMNNYINEPSTVDVSKLYSGGIQSVTLAGLSFIAKVGETRVLVTHTLDPGAFAYKFREGLLLKDIGLLSIARHIINHVILAQEINELQEQYDLEVVLKKSNALSVAIGLDSAIAKSKMDYFNYKKEDPLKGQIRFEGEPVISENFRKYMKSKGSQRGDLYMPKTTIEKEQLINELYEKSLESLNDGTWIFGKLPCPTAIRSQPEKYKLWLQSIPFNSDISAAARASGSYPSYISGTEEERSKAARTRFKKHPSSKGLLTPEKVDEHAKNLVLHHYSLSYLETTNNKDKRLYYKKCSKSDCSRLHVYHGKQYKIPTCKAESGHGFDKKATGKRIYFLLDLPNQ